MKKLIDSEKFSNGLEIFIAVLLGVTAVLTAYASWQSSLYGGNQAGKYTQGTATISEANSMFNDASQFIAQDMAVWNRITDLRIDLEFAKEKNDALSEERNQWKLDQIMADNVTPEFQKAIEWADAQKESTSPFVMPGFIESYSDNAQVKYDEGKDQIAEGEKANGLGDILGLVTVIFSVVLFLLGICNTFKNIRTRLVIGISSVISLMFGLVIMFNVPYVSL